MSRWIWPALLLAVIVTATFAATTTAAKRKAQPDPRPKTVTKGLDFLHATQKTNGGFGTMANTAWGIMGAVAAGERMGSSMWKVGGKGPFDYLQSNSHEAAATGSGVDNAPEYYARAVMAYVAVDQRVRVFVAGTPRVDLLAKLYGYQDLSDGATKGAFSPSTSSRDFQAVHTTAWAILAMHAMGEDEKDRFGLAIAWLADQQRDDGGFPSESVRGAVSNVEDTALAIQALELDADAPTVDPAIIPAARAYLKAQQRADGGFPHKTGGATDSEATAVAIQAILAMGEKPDDAFWKEGINTPAHALGTLQLATGAYAKTRGAVTQPVATTSWALIALRSRPFTVFPAAIGAPLKGFVFRPQLNSASPQNGAKYTQTRVILIRATYTDGRKGTGVRPSACRVVVDSVNRTKAAAIGPYGLRLQLKNVPDGVHTYVLEIVDHAGNVKEVARKFTVDLPSPAPTPLPTTGPTYYTPNPVTPPAHTSTPAPVTTLTPAGSPSPNSSYTPYPSPSGQPVTGAPVASPSPSGSPGAPGTGADGGGGSAAGYVGGTLLAMLPIGAAVSYLVLRRREDALGAAGDGKVLAGGGSAWERLKGTLAKSKDLVKPASRK
jgi:hypothetical protein